MSFGTHSSVLLSPIGNCEVGLQQQKDKQNNNNNTRRTSSGILITPCNTSSLRIHLNDRCHTIQRRRACPLATFFAQRMRFCYCHLRLVPLPPLSTFCPAPKKTHVAAQNCSKKAEIVVVWQNNKPAHKRDVQKVSVIEHSWAQDMVQELICHKSSFKIAINRHHHRWHDWRFALRLLISRPFQNKTEIWVLSKSFDVQFLEFVGHPLDGQQNNSNHKNLLLLL